MHSVEMKPNNAAGRPKGRPDGPGPIEAMHSVARWMAARELWLVAACAPLLLFPGPWTWVGLGAIVFAWLCRWMAKGRPTVTTPGDVPILMMLCMSVVGLWVALDPSLSLPALWRVVLGVAVYYALANGWSSPQRQRWLPWLLVACSLVLTVASLVGTDWDAVRLLRLSEVYGRLPRLLRDLQDQQAFHPRIMGMALVTLLPILLALLFSGQEKCLRLLAGITALMVGLTLALTQSLQAAVGLGCALLFLGACWRRWVLISVPLALAASLLALLACGVPRVAEAVLSTGNPLGIAVALRWDMWSRAWAMLQDMPYTGIGLDQFPVIQTHFYPGVLLGAEPHAHNLFLQVALDLGLPGLLALLWLLVSIAWAALKAYARCQEGDQRALLLGSLGGMVAYLGAGLLDTIWTAKASVVLWLVLGVMATVITAVHPTPAPNQPRAQRARVLRWGPVLLLIMLLVAGLLVAPSALQLNQTVVRAQRWLLSAREGTALKAEDAASLARDLERLTRLDAGNPQLYSLLGCVQAWLGDYGAATTAFARRVELDGQNPLARYAPFEHGRRRLVGTGQSEPWKDLGWVYSQWASRYPERAEYYMLVALLRQEYLGNPEGAVQALNAGIERGAEPRGVLLHQLGTMRHIEPEGAS